MANTSGQGSTIVVPDEIKGWNWGAFFMTLIWGIPNRVWSSLLVFIPGVGTIMPFVLGLKGSEWAWQNKEWESVEHFREVQRKWALWGIGTTVAGVVLVIAVFVGIGLFGGFDDTDDASASDADTTSVSEPIEQADGSQSAAPEAPSNETKPIAAAPAAVSPVVSPLKAPSSIATATTAPTPVAAAIAAPIAGKDSLIADAALPDRFNAPRKKYVSADLRECLHFQSNEAIARCAEQF